MTFQNAGAGFIQPDIKAPSQPAAFRGIGQPNSISGQRSFQKGGVGMAPLARPKAGLLNQNPPLQLPQEDVRKALLNALVTMNRPQDKPGDIGAMLALMGNQRR